MSMYQLLTSLAKYRRRSVYSGTGYIDFYMIKAIKRRRTDALNEFIIIYKKLKIIHNDVILSIHAHMNNSSYRLSKVVIFVML